MYLLSKTKPHAKECLFYIVDHTKGIFKTQANNVINDISNCVTNNFSNSVVNNTLPLFTICLSSIKFSLQMWDLDFKGTKHMISKQEWFTSYNEFASPMML